MPEQLQFQQRFSRSAAQAQHDIDEHALAAMSMYDHSQGATILSPTPRALTFPTHPMFDINLDGPTPRAFTFPTTVHESMSNGNHRGPLFTPPEPSPSTPSTSSSPFEPEQQRQNQSQQQQQPQFTAPTFGRRSQSVQRGRAETASPAAQISSFNAPDPNPGAPLTLAARRRGSSISSLALPAHTSHTLNFAQPNNSQAASQVQPPATLPPNPHAHAIQLAGTERRPKRGDEDYIKRPENAFILFRRECCLKKNEAEAAAAQEGDPVQRRQRQADLSKMISQQWRSLSAEERKYWDDLAKQRKKEHEEMYPWYVYQPTRSDKKKKKDESTAGGKAKREKEGKKDRRERTKSSSRVRGTGARARNSSTCSTISMASTTSMSSSASTVDSEDFSELDSVSAESSLYGSYGYANGQCGSVREVEAADMADFDMSESEGSQGQDQAQTLSLPLSLSMPSLSGAAGSGNLAIDTRNALASFSLESGPMPTSSYSHSHHGGHGHSLSAQIPSQVAQSLVPGPLSFVLPQNRRSTSAPGAPTPPPMPADLYPPAPPTIKIPQLLDTSNNGSNNSSAVASPAMQEVNPHEQHAQMNGHGQTATQQPQREGEYNMMNGFQFPNAHAQPQQMGFGMPGQVPNFPSAASDIQQNSMFHVYEEPPTAKPRPRALSQLTIPNEPPANTGPLSAPAPNDSSAASSSRLFFPAQYPAHGGQSSSEHLQVPQRAVPQGLPESPEPPAVNEWDDYGLPSWAMSTFTDAEEAALQQQNAQQQRQGQGMQVQPQNVFGEIDISMDMGLPPWMDFGSMDPISSLGAMNAMGCGMDGMSTDEGDRVEQFAMQFQYEELLDPSQL